MRSTFILIFVLFSLNISASNTSSNLPRDVELKIKNFAEENSFAGAVSVVRAGNVLYESYHGLADRENGSPNDRLTSFRIGSITKELTATAVLILGEQRRLDLNAYVSEYLPVPKEWKNIKVFHLLSHSAGIENQATYRNYENLSFRDAPESVIQKWLSEIDVLKEPGTFAYSNAGYNVLACLLERRTGKLYHELLQDLIFDPLEMSGASVTFRPLQNYPPAKGYDKDGKVIEFDMSNYIGAGEVTMTLSDFSKWTRGVTTPGILLAQPQELFKKRVKWRSQFYGFGFMVHPLPQGIVAGHNGWTPGFVSAHFFDTTSGSHVFLFSNDERWARSDLSLDSVAFDVLKSLAEPFDFLSLIRLQRTQ